MTPQADFQSAFFDQLSRALLEPAAQKALPEALSAPARPAKAARTCEEVPLAEWLGEPPA